MQFTRYTLADDCLILSESIIIDEDDGYIDIDTPLSESAASYARDLRGIARALWNGSMDFDQSFALFQDTVRLGLTRAWYEGAKECGIQPSELSPEELTALRDVLYSENIHIFGFLDYVQLNNKKSGGKFGVLSSRIDTWALRYPDVINRAKLMACADQKLEWMNNAVRVVKVNCSSCLRLNGKVKRASYWQRVDVHPQMPPNPKLECGGWECGCGLVKTDKPLSKGPLPKLP